MQSNVTQELKCDHKDIVWTKLTTGAGVLGSLLVSLVVSARLFPLGIPGEWVWEYRKIGPSPTSPFALAIVGVALIALLVQLWKRVPKARWERAMFIALLMILTLAVRFTAGRIEPAVPSVAVRNASIVVSPIATTFFLAAREVEQEGVSTYLDSYHERIIRYPSHAGTHPPGAVLYFWAIRRVAAVMPWLKEWGIEVLGGVEGVTIACAVTQHWTGATVSPDELATAWLAAQALILIGGLAVVFVWAAACSQSMGQAGDPVAKFENRWRAGLIAVGAYAVAPGGLLFLPVLDQLLLALTAIMVWLGASWWANRDSRRRTFLAALLGLTAAVGLFCSFKFIPIIGCVGLWLLLEECNSGDSIKDRVENLRAAVVPWITLLLSLILPFVLLDVVFHFNLLTTFKVALGSHGVETLEAKRTYWMWLFVNPLDFFYMGIGAVFLGVVVFANWRAYTEGLLKRFAPLVALAITIALLSVSGLVRGEVARLWLPFLPVASVGMARWGLTSPRHLMWLFLVQILQVLMLRWNVEFVRPY